MEAIGGHQARVHRQGEIKQMEIGGILCQRRECVVVAFRLLAQHPIERCGQSREEMHGGHRGHQNLADAFGAERGMQGALCGQPAGAGHGAGEIVDAERNQRGIKGGVDFVEMAERLSRGDPGARLELPCERDIGRKGAGEVACKSFGLIGGANACGGAVAEDQKAQGGATPGLALTRPRWLGENERAVSDGQTLGQQQREQGQAEPEMGCGHGTYSRVGRMRAASALQVSSQEAVSRWPWVRAAL